MKKHISRLLSAALVLVMVLGMVPAVSAANELTVKVTAAKKVLTYGTDENTTLTAEVTNAPSEEGWSAQYSWSGGGVTGSGPSTVYTPELNDGENKKSVEITCTVTYTKDGVERKASGKVDIEVVRPQLQIVGPAEAEKGKEIPLSYKVLPEGAQLPASATPNWSLMSGSTSAELNNGTFKANQAGVYTVKLEAGGLQTTHDIRVIANDYTVTLNKTALELYAGQSETLTAAVKDKDGKTVTPAAGSLTWAAADSKVTVAGGKVTAAAAGETAVTATYQDENNNTYTASCTVKVLDGGAITNLEHVNQKWSNSAAGRSVQLNPRYVGANSENVVLVYSIGQWSTGNKISVDDKGVVSASSPAAAQVLVAAYPKKADGTADKTGDPLASKEVYVSLYPDNSGMVVNMATGVTSFRFDDAKAINQTTYNSLQHQILSEVLVMNSSRDMIFFDYNDYSGKIGKLSNLYSQLNNSQYVDKLGEVTFSITGGTGGQWKFSYTVKDITEKVILGTGSVTIQFDGGTEVAYATDYTKAVTVLESDFYKAWKASGTTGDLDYVQFTITSGNPANGKMYVTPSSTLQVYEATYTDKFAYGTGAVPSGFYDLGSLTFVPNRSKTTTYTEKIAFTMYGKTSGQVAYGTLVFKVNEKGTSITPRGISFSGKYDSTLSCADWIAAQYKAETNADLGRVIFKLPAAEDGTLYAAVPASGGVSQFARAERLGINTEVYYVKTSGKTQLKDLAFVPAAGKSGTITIQYTAYNQAGTDPVEGTLLFQVVNASKSAVFSDVTMAWAADSVDFLYYEGIAKGSGGKYNPNSNITRGDFMLMLYRAFLADTYGTTAVTDNFPDVVKGTTAYSQETYQAIGIAKKLGIAQGSNGRYNPKANITRQEAMTLIYRTITCREVDRTLRYDSNTYASSLKDFSKVAAYAQSPIRYLVEHGVIKGDSDKNINPLANITRAEMACILHRVITY